MKENTLESITKGAEEKENELDKYMLIYSKLAHKMSYDLDFVGKEEKEESMLVLESELEKGKTTSTGYSELLKKCLENVGIESKCIKGKIEDRKHTWNQVKLDDKWYNTDLTLDRENILEEKELEYTLKSDKEFSEHIPTTLDVEQCAQSMPKETLAEYEYILKYETNDLFEIIEKVENKTEDKTVITYDEDSEEMLLVNDTGIKDVPVTKEQFFNIMDDKDENQIYVVDELKQEYEKNKELEMQQNLPAIYKENKLLNFFNDVKNKFMDKFFNKGKSDFKEQVEEKSETNMFSELRHNGFAKTVDSTKTKQKVKSIEEKEEIR